MDSEVSIFTAFAGFALIARGDLTEVVAAVKKRSDLGESERIAIYEDATGRSIEIDLRGTMQEVTARLASHPLLASQVESQPAAPSGPGRPRLGVVAREVTLLPRHWDWLGRQSGGASAAIRKLVDTARKQGVSEEREKQASEAIHRFMWDMAGNLPGFEEASRSFYRHDRAGFEGAHRRLALGRSRAPRSFGRRAACDGPILTFLPSMTPGCPTTI